MRLQKIDNRTNFGTARVIVAGSQEPLKQVSSMIKLHKGADVRLDSTMELSRRPLIEEAYLVSDGKEKQLIESAYAAWPKPWEIKDSVADRPETKRIDISAIGDASRASGDNFKNLESIEKWLLGLGAIIK